MNEEKMREAAERMNLALLPRDESGLIIPMDFWGPNAQVAMYPVIKPDKDGLLPGMLFAEDFADGKKPEYLDYALGWEKPGMSFERDGFGAIVYENPVLNLTPVDQMKLAAVNEFIVHPEMRQQELADLLGIHVVERESDVHGDTPVVERHGRLCLPIGNGHFRAICNFTVRILNRRILHKRGAPEQEEIHLQVQCNGVTHSLVVNNAGIDFVVSKVKSTVPGCRIEVEVPRATSYLTNYIRELIHNTPVCHVLLSPGYEKLDEGWVYVHDGAKVSAADMVIETGCTIPCRAGVSPAQASRDALSFLAVSPRLELLLPLFLLAHLGPLSGLFEAAGYFPRFVTFLNGTTGSLKTSIALCLFRLFSEQSDVPEASFNDTMAALILLLGKGAGRVLLVDDYRPAVTRSAGKDAEEKLETIIRFAGDNISRTKSTVSGQLKHSPKLSGCLLVTGENTGGSQSSLLRCLVLSIHKDDISGPALKTFQDDPLLMQSHLYHFLNWCGYHGDTIVEMIQTNFEDERISFSKVTKERRQIDTGATLAIVADLLLQYLAMNGAITRESKDQIRERWHEALQRAIRSSVDAGKELDPVGMFFRAYFDLLLTGRISVAADQKSFDPKTHIGFRKDGFVWLLPHDLHTHVERYWSGGGVVFPLKEQKVRELMHYHGLIKTATENRNGTEKILFLCRSSLPSRPNLLVLNEELARKYLDSVDSFQ